MESFPNLFSFFSYIEFCPLCKARTTECVIYPTTQCTLSSKNILLFDDVSKSFSINLLDNSISGNYSRKSDELIIGKRCNKYHFFYSGSATISNTHINNISLNKLHFIRIHNMTHYVINNSFETNITSIRVTENFQTQEISLPLIEFDFSSKKKLDTKLNHIRLLV